MADYKLLFTDPIDPAWTLVEFAGKTLVHHMCADSPVQGDMCSHPVSKDACKWCAQKPPEGSIALYKLYTWDEQ